MNWREHAESKASNTDALPINVLIYQVLRCFFNLGPRALEMLQAPRYLNPALLLHKKKSFSHSYPVIFHQDIWTLSRVSWFSTQFPPKWMKHHRLFRPPQNGNFHNSSIQARNHGGLTPYQIFRLPWKKCWTWLNIIGHSLKKVVPSQKTPLPPGVPSWLRACINVVSCRQVFFFLLPSHFGDKPWITSKMQNH